MASAWIITQEGTSHTTEVIGILSARLHPREVKDRVEWLYALLNYEPKSHMELAKYKNPFNAYPADFTHSDNTVHCGHNPFLVCRRANNVELIEAEGKEVLRWTEPDRIVRDPRDFSIKEKIIGRSREAPVGLPLRR